MLVKTSELSCVQLNRAVAQCEGVTRREDWEYSEIAEHCYTPSTNWAQGGPIIQRENIEWQWLPATDKAHQYGARKPSLGGLNRTFCMDGPTILIAAMRCYVASKLGAEVEVPDASA